MASPRKPSGKRRGPRAGLILTKLVVYPMAAIGGSYMGVQAYESYAARHGAPLGALTRASAASAAEPTRLERVAAARQSERSPSRREEPEVTVREKAETETGLPETLPEDEGAPGGGLMPADDVTPMPPVEIERGSGRRPEVALTFDAGADWRPAKKIVETLQAEGVKSTFFLTGEWVEKNPKTTRLITAEGHELGNHSWDHPPFTDLSDDDIRSQLRRTEEIIHETAGKSSRPYFRPPLGARDMRVRKIVGDEGYLTVYWTLDSRDSVDRGITAQQVRERVLEKAAPGSIILLHCGSQATAEALPEIIRGLKSKGLTPVTVGRLLEQ